MKIILNEAVAKLGEKGELKEVKEGYARNFLFPQNLAVPASKSAIKKLKEEEENKEKDNTKLKEEAQNNANSLEGQVIAIEVKAENNGKLFGSITEKVIAENIKKLTGIEIDAKSIEVSEPIKKIGDYKINVSLHKEVKASVNIKIVAQNK